MTVLLKKRVLLTKEEIDKNFVQSIFVYSNFCTTIDSISSPLFNCFFFFNIGDYIQKNSLDCFEKKWNL